MPGEARVYHGLDPQRGRPRRRDHLDGQHSLAAVGADGAPHRHNIVALAGA